MRGSSFVESRARSDRVVWQRMVLPRWTNGLRCCAKPCGRTTTDWTKFCPPRFGPPWNNPRKAKRDEQADTQDGRRHTRGGDKTLCCASRGRVSRAHRSKTHPEMAARSGKLDDARLHQ